MFRNRIQLHLNFKRYLWKCWRDKQMDQTNSCRGKEPWKKVFIINWWKWKFLRHNLEACRDALLSERFLLRFHSHISECDVVTGVECLPMICLIIFSQKINTIFRLNNSLRRNEIYELIYVNFSSGEIYAEGNWQLWSTIIGVCCKQLLNANCRTINSTPQWRNQFGN